MPLNKNLQVEIKKMAILDEEDIWLLDKYSWFIDGFGYITGDKTKNGNKQRIKLHHLVIGKPPKGLCIDHKNGNKLDNRKENLHIVPYAYNLTNKPKRKDSKQLIKAIEKLPSGRFSVKVTGGKRLGTFNLLEEAIKIRDNYYYKKFNLNLTNA